MLPIKLNIENFFSHKNSEIDFSLFNSALLVGNVDGDYFKSNGAGKSALFEALLWSLYNKSRSSTMDDVIMRGENKCVVSIHFSHLNNEYSVKRTRMRDTSTSTVDFLILEQDGSWKSLSGTTSGETNDRIVDLLKIDYKTFVNSAYFRQNDISEFTTSEASKKKEILKSIVDISKWDSYEKSAKKKAKDIQTEIIKDQAKYDALKSEIEVLSLSVKELAVASEYLEEKTNRKLLLQPKIESLSEKYLKTKNNIDTESWDKATADITILKVNGRDLTSRYDTVLSVLGKRIERKDELSIRMAGLESKVLALSFDPDISTKLETLSMEWAEYSGAIQQSNIKLKELSGISLHEGECYTCKQEIASDIFDRLSSEHRNNLDHYLKKKSNSESRITYLSGLKSELLKQQQDNAIIEKSQSEIESIKSQLLLLSEEISSGEIEKDGIYSKLLAVRQGIVDNEKVLSSLKDETFQSLHDDLKKAKAASEVLSSEILQAGIKVGSLKEKVSSLSKKKEELLSIKKSFDVKNLEMSVFDKMVKMFGKSGIQTLLLDVVISDLEKSANRILSSISDQFSISLETQRAGSDGVSIVETLDLNVKMDGLVCGFASLSGGEQFRIALALRIALSELATQHGGSSLEFLLLDEINSPLDKSGVETLFVNIIKQLESKYKILVITHDDSLKERFDNVIDITKTNGESFVSFSSSNNLS